MAVISTTTSEKQQQNNNEDQHGLLLKDLFDLADFLLNRARQVLVLTFCGQFRIPRNLPHCLLNFALYFMQLAFYLIVCTLCHASGKASQGPSQRPLACPIAHETKELLKMLWTIFVVALILWLLGLVTSYTMGGLIHILLVIAVIALVFQLISGRRSIL